ncbi:MAG: hypothetical protein JXR52_06520 [Bacteroidales bacterium]|nr:hypothetical protein [Bacteroidales bacterium]MBN2698463.1 hypothetical protein [Bacteroidales bacterium]
MKHKTTDVKHSRSLLIVPLVFIMASACRQSPVVPETLEADFIRYRIHYLEEQAGDIPTKLLPATMEAYYTDYYILTRIEGFLNQFSLVQVADLKLKSVSTLLNFFGNKLYYTGESKELPAGIVPLTFTNLDYKNDTAVFSGLLSHRIEVELEDHTRYNIYYTRSIDVRKPNITTPYHSIPHVLTDFRIQLSYLKMNLVCTDHDHRYIESAEFQIPPDYQPVSKKNMEEIINSLFTKD